VLIETGLLQWWSVGRMGVSGQGFVGGLINEGAIASRTVVCSQGQCWGVVLQATEQHNKRLQPTALRAHESAAFLHLLVILY